MTDTQVDDGDYENEDDIAPIPANTEFKDESGNSESEDEHNSEPKSPAIATSIPTQKSTKIKRKPSLLASQQPKKSKVETKVDSELNLLNTLQSSIISRNKDRKEPSIQTAEELFGKMVGEDLKALPPIVKLQARNEIQNIIFKYHMAAMPDSLHRKLSTTTMIDSNSNSSPMKSAANSFLPSYDASFQNSLSPNSSISLPQGNNTQMGHWIQSLNNFQ